LFEGTECKKIKSSLDHYYLVTQNNSPVWVSWNNTKTIEDLIQYNLELTPTALKHLTP